MNEITFKLNRERMIKMLEAFDKELDKPLKLAITGASALIIQDCITRASKDIDILNASDDLTKDGFKRIIEKLAIQYGLDHEWLNNKAKITYEDLPDYKPDLVWINGDFKFLEPFVISKADSVITKFARFTNIRPWDEQDIRTTQFDNEDFKMIRRKLEELFLKDPERSLRIEIKFKSLKPEFIKTEDGFKYSNSAEIGHYAFKRYGIILEDKFQKYLDEDALNLNTSFDKAVIDIDNMALKKILKEKNKGKEYGLDL